MEDGCVGAVVVGKTAGASLRPQPVGLPPHRVTQPRPQELPSTPSLRRGRGPHVWSNPTGHSTLTLPWPFTAPLRWRSWMTSAVSSPRVRPLPAHLQGRLQEADGHLHGASLTLPLLQHRPPQHCTGPEGSTQGQAGRAKFFCAVQRDLNCCNSIGALEMHQHLEQLKRSIYGMHFYSQDVKRKRRKNCRNQNPSSCKTGQPPHACHPRCCHLHSTVISCCHHGLHDGPITPYPLCA